jgi:hypothetical protein
MKLELIKAIMTHVFTGKKIEMIFLIRRRKGETLQDALLSSFDLGGMHIHKVTKMRMRRKAILVSQTEIKRKR